MEKFRGFADPATGIHPFLPVWNNEPKSLNFKKIKNIFIAMASWPLRLLFILIALLFLPINKLKRYGCKLLLLSMGIWKINIKDLETLNEIKTAKDSLVFCNLTSFVEILILEYTISPIYAIAHLNGTLSILKFMEMISFLSQHNVKPCKGTLANLANAADYISSKHIGPLVIFPEMQKSNGTVILEWPNGLATNFNFARGGGCYAMVCNYEILGMSYGKPARIPHTVGSIYRHLFNIALNPKVCVRLEIIPRDSVAKVMKKEAPVKELRKLMAKKLGKGGSIVGVDASRLSEFAKYYENNS